MTSITSDSELSKLYPDDFLFNLHNDFFKKETEDEDFKEEINKHFRRMLFSARLLFNFYKNNSKKYNIEDFLEAYFNEEKKFTYKQQLIKIFKSFHPKYEKIFYYNHNNEEIIEKLKSKIYEDSDDKILFFDSN